MNLLLRVAAVCVSAQVVIMGQAPATPPTPPEPRPNATLYQARGEQYRIYNFPATGESIPYRLFVPSR